MFWPRPPFPPSWAPVTMWHDPKAAVESVACCAQGGSPWQPCASTLLHGGTRQLKQQCAGLPKDTKAETFQMCGAVSLL